MRRGPKISIHALLAESDRSCCTAHQISAQFLSTLSLRRATRSASAFLPASRFLSTLSLRRATGDFLMQPYLNIFLSTLSLRRATRYASQTAAHMIFLSTLSLRRATNTFRPSTSFTRYFYPRSPCGERHAVAQHGYNLNCNFYPRSPCGERRGTDRGVSIRYGFLSTLSLRRATQIVLTLVSKLNEFLSTLSLRRATIARCLQGWHKPISIHALLAESDLLCAAGWAALKISIHALLAESDPMVFYDFACY